MKRLLLILLFPTLALTDIDKVNTEVTLPYWPTYILSGDPNELDEYLRILLKSLQDIQDSIVTAVNFGIDLSDTNTRYFGTKNTSGVYPDGTWRITKIDSDDFEVQKKIDGTWTQMSKWTETGGFEYLTIITDSGSSFTITSGTITGAVDITAEGTVTGGIITDGTFVAAAGAISATTLTLSPLTIGSVLFVGASGILSQDNVSLFWDNTNNYFGILTASPTAALDVNSDIVRFRTTKTPTGSDDDGNTGDRAWDEDFLYAYTGDQWKRLRWQSWYSLLLETGDYILLENGSHILLE